MNNEEHVTQLEKRLLRIKEIAEEIDYHVNIVTDDEVREVVRVILEVIKDRVEDDQLRKILINDIQARVIMK